MGKTLFDKIWDSHVVSEISDGPSILYIDRQFIHEVTSPQAFSGLENRGRKVFRPDQITATADHNIPTENQHLPIKEQLSALQVEKLKDNSTRHGITYYGLGDVYNGIVHVVGPELGYTQPGMTIVCGDSHTSTHGAFGSVAFGVGTSEVEMVFASQCVLQPKPKKMRIIINGELGKGVTSKDLILYVLSQLTASGATGYFIEFAGSAIRNMTMEARMTVCNMSIELGARGGMIAPDQTTFEYVKGRKYAPQGADFDAAVEKWKELYSDDDAVFDKEYTFESADITPMVTYGTNPGLGMKIADSIPSVSSIEPSSQETFKKALKYMNFEENQQLLGKEIDWVFIGSCTNGRIEDFRLVASILKGRTKAPHINTYVVPGSYLVAQQIKEEGIDKILEEAGVELREPGCSSCLAMNDDKVPPGKYCVATSNRNFEGRQGPGSRTILASPLTAAAAIITGKITDPREFL
ncbi:MAG: 3-isopropylmalate dehydratase large subunit [Bacteroidales bacterium]|jgi:3-isopropylmalate/(R)-2-methylmalate dehydratase large subunit|nr:3-isopropylmalate dehydratase large subunit [Bacteroidales bacterium]